MIGLSDFYQSVFSCKVYKLSLDAGCTCPNRDGTKGTGGCIFCSPRGSGDFASNPAMPISLQIEEAKEKVASKLKGRTGKRPGKYIAYFQNFSSTYGDARILIQKYREALNCEGVAGLSVATRADCLSEEILCALGELANEHFVQIELGLQTSNEKTGDFINRCYTNDDYEDAVLRIKKVNPSIHVVTHLIFGLPGEGEKDMLSSVDFVRAVHEKTLGAVEPGSPSLNTKKAPWQNLYGLKITVLYVLSGTALEALYKRGDFQMLSKEEYFDLLKKALLRTGEHCVVHRLTGDPPKKTLIAPLWTTDKKRVLNEIRSLIL